MKFFVSSNTQTSTTFSDVFARLERELDQFQPPKGRAAALATVDKDIDAAKRLILSMLTRRNTLAPISILPAEILARIFRFNAAAVLFPDYVAWLGLHHACMPALASGRARRLDALDPLLDL